MGIFDKEVNLYDSFVAKIQFKTWIVGGQPKNPKDLTEMYMRRMGATGEELLRREFVRIIVESGKEFDPKMGNEEMAAVIEQMAVGSGNGFKSDDNGLYIESYQIKAAFRENTNIAYAGELWGKTKKGAKAYMAERLFVDPDRIHLGRKEPDGVLRKTGVVSGPQGKRSILTQSEYVDRAEIQVTIRIARNAPELLEALPEIWVRMQDNGLGAMRSSGFGRFDLISWEQIGRAAIKKLAVKEEKASKAKKAVAA